MIQNESNPPAEKIFLIFETHTERASKGETGVPQEPGKRVSIVEDEYGLWFFRLIREDIHMILNHIMTRTLSIHLI